MNYTTKDKKVLQAITIGLAAMITATSMPTVVYADDEAIVENTQSNETVNTQSESSSVAETVNECTEITSDNGLVSETTEAINEASDAVGEIISTAEEQKVEVPVETLTNIQNELQQSADEIAQSNENLEIAIEAFNKTLVSDLKTDTIVNNSNADIKTVENKVNEFNDSKNTTTEYADNAIIQAEIANTSNSRKEAYEAKDNAIEELGNAEENLKIAEDAYQVAKDAVDSAEEKYQKALSEQKETKEKLAEAKEKLKNANENATAANERLKAIQAQMDAIDKEVTNLAQSKEDLQALQDQYYKLMVHYYRDNNINSAVYNEDGKLLIEESADKAKENGKTEKTSVTENTMKIGRELMKDLVIYKLKANGAEDIQFAVEEKGLTKKESADGTLTEDNKGNDRVIIEEVQDQYWDYQSGDDGRHHNVKVTYAITLEDGTKKEVTEYYNYIIKSGKYNDDNDLVNGPIYLAQINPDTGEVIRDTDKNNMDDFTKLSEQVNKAIEAAKIVDKYNEAKSAVDDAQQLVDNLNQTIKTLSEKDLKVNEERISDLKEKLDKAKEILQTATEDKEKLEEKVEEARKAVESINLSRFNRNPQEDPEDETEPETPSEPTVIIPTDIVPIPGDIETPIIVTPPIAPVLPSISEVEPTTEDAGVAGVKLDPSEEIANDNLSNTENQNNKDLTKIEDNDVPLSQIPHLDEIEYSWTWLFILLLLLLIAYITYKVIKNQEEKNKQ